MKTNIFLLRRISAKTRYHTSFSQSLALLQQILFALFLLSGWQDHLVSLTSWAIFAILLALFIQSRMFIERPTRRGLRRVIRQVEVIAIIGNAALLVFLSGSAAIFVVLFVVYVVIGALTTELHEGRWIYFD